MKLSLYVPALTAIILNAKNANGQVWYPDYMGGSGTCLNDGEEQKWVLDNNQYEDSLVDCCDRFYNWDTADLCKCYEDGGGTPCTGTDEWYVDYQNKVCVQDCPEDGASCGGLASRSDVLFADAESCCGEKLQSISTAYCTAMSETGTYIGSLMAYVKDSLCVLDCDAAVAPICGGIITDLTPTYADIATCCSTGLAFMNPDICEALSDPASTGSGLFHSDQENNRCVRDADAGVCPTGNTCVRAEATVYRVFDTAEECCAGVLAWVNSDLCLALTEGTPSGKWFVDYQNDVCVADCDDGSFECVDITSLDMLPTTVYDSALECCEAALPSQKPEYCADYSVGDTPTGTLEWYVDYENKGCVQDCPTADADTCGGLASDQELFADETSCCEDKLTYLAVGFCEANSNAEDYLGSGDYYVDYENKKCVIDCEGDPECGGIVEESSVTLYADIASCCAGKLSTMDADLCEALSDPDSTGTRKYYPDIANSMCLYDEDTCPTGHTCERADATVSDTYDTAEACCEADLAWVHPTFCVGATTGTYSDEWTPDYENLVCVQDCAAGASCVDIKTIEPVPSKFYASSLECCQSTFGWTDPSICESASDVGLANHEGTDKWYKKDDICVQDCDDVATCGGILPLGTSETTYDDEAECCEKALGWLNSDICEGISLLGEAAWTGTGDWYSTSDDLCRQDCDTGSPCGGILEAATTKNLYGSPEECCAGEFAWIDNELCAAISDDDWSGDFYKGEGDACSQHCPTGDGLPCGGDPSDLSVTMHDTLEACCAAHVDYLTEDECIAESTGTTPSGSTDFYVDWLLEKCVMDCPESEGAPCGGLKGKWDGEGYSTAEACCARLSWVKASECVLA